MTGDTIVKDPERIRNLDELEGILSRIIAFEGERKCNAGVLLIQRRLFGGFYMIFSKEKADQYISRPVSDRTPEWGIKFYPRSYFEELREKLNGEKQESYS